MLYAEYGHGGRPISLRDFLQLEGFVPKEWKTQPICPCCDTELIGNDKPGAHDVSSARDEVTARRRKQYRTGAGYSHPAPDNENSPIAVCPKYYKNNKNFRGSQLALFVEPNAFHKLEKARNEEELRKPAVAKAVKIVREFLMEQLTGSPEISADDMKKIDRITKSVIGLAGMKDNIWALPFIQVMALGETMGEVKLGYPRKIYNLRVRYEGAGTRTMSFSYASSDVERMENPESKKLTGQGRLQLPARLVAKHAKPGGEFVPTRGDNDKLVLFYLSREFAHKIVKDKLEQERRSKRQDVVSTDPLVLEVFLGKPPRQPPKRDPKFKKNGEPRKPRPSRSHAAINERAMKKHGRALTFE